MPAAHFSPETLKFLRGLVKHNDREWFEARRDVFERSVKAPLHALIEDVNGLMTEFAPEHVRPPARVAMRIYRDTRFSPDKRPYKRQISAWCGTRGNVRTTGAGFYFHLSTTDVVIAAGVFMTTPQQLLSLRGGLAERYASYRQTLAGVLSGKKKPSFAVSESEGLKRVPRPFAPDHPAQDLLRAKRWGVGLELPSEAALQPDFAQVLAERFRQAAPLVAVLDAMLSGGEPAASRL